MRQDKELTEKKEKKIIESELNPGIVISSRRKYIYSEESDETIKLEKLLLNLLAEHGPLTRNELVKLTKLPRSTLYDNLVKLIDRGLVKKESLPRKTRGRPKVVFKLN